ncbi:uncharacterized protein LOC120643848 [Panicum virgatum]|uniref:Transmembrane protein n=1 Tax=Panicum virgatum TaxID=38727 RepID=A0A8T0PIK6_PANVG|nr:uncharacterized protein LOC120643848 [Panicum virgatum]KAG2560748.1 hypothetical protein PVAP13_8KG083400 [Panicum virgatum]
MASEVSKVKNGDQSNKKPVFHKSMGTVAGLRKLLPDGTTLAFETMAPAFTRGGQCNDHDVNFVFTWWLVGFLTVLCMILSFTDSFTDKDGNTHYGVATPKGFMLFNGDLKDLQLPDDELEALKKRIKWNRRDFLHAILRAAMFVALAFCDAGLQRNGIGEVGGGPSSDTDGGGHKGPETTTAKDTRRLVDKSVGIAASLSMLLPSSATLAFETLVPSFTNGGACSDHDVNFVFTWGLIVFLTVLCGLLRFTDRVADMYGNTYFVLATRNGFKLFSHERKDLRLSEDEHENRMKWKDLRRRMKRKPRDFLHAFFSSAVFMVLAFCNAEVQACLVPTETWQWKKFLAILPLAVGFLASFVFVIFPSTRKGIGEEDGSCGTKKRGDAAAAPGGGQSPLQAAMPMSIIRVASSTSYQLDPVV